MKNIKKERTQSLLKELLPCALANLSDTRLNSLNVVDVKCSQGKYFAEVFLDASYLDEKEKKAIQSQLKKANGLIKEYCLEETSWYRCPDFKFIFDESLEAESRLDAIFHKLEKEKETKEAK